MSKPFEDYSREELIAACKGMTVGLLYLQNYPSLSMCPFCERTGFVPFLKQAIKKDLIEAWKTDVTQEEYEAYLEEMSKAFSKESV